MGIRDLKRDWKIFDSLYERLLVVLLCLSGKLEMLLICLVDYQRYGAFCRAMQRVAQSSSIAPILPRFSTLHLLRRPDPEIIEESDEAIPREFIQFWNFTRLCVQRIRGCHEFRNDISWVNRLRELKIVSGVAAKELFHVCQLAVQLENLSLVITEGSTFPNGNPPIGEDLNCALTARATTLKVLELRLCGHTSYKHQFGQSKHLACLVKLEKLEQLTIDIPLVFGFEFDHEPPTLSKFPRHLVSLNLVDGWWPSLTPYLSLRTSGRKERRFVEALLNLFASQSCAKFPKLRLNQLCYIQRAEDPCLSSNKLDGIKASFNQNRLSFSYKKDTLAGLHHIEE
ncbi:hypothetical protein F5Y05DRAFT_236080 [Hypoxylon sp. FL0543]|nr:hypothetical protein F5Y05DRAFT_236080 [Hypoxylon sp. FL0543]